MSTPSLIVRIAANMQELRQNLAEGKAQVETTTRALQNMSRAFSGDAIIRDANAMASAIGGVANVSTLTEREQRRVNATVSEAIAKYNALGREAPADLLKLQSATAGAVEKTSLLTRGAQALIAAVSVRAVAGLASDVLQLTGKLSDLSGKTGIGVEALQRLSFVTSQSGVSLEQVSTGVVKMGRALVDGDKGAVAAVNALHLNVGALIAAGPERAFLQIGEAIAKVPNPMEQAALATALFGRAGADYLPAFTTQMSELADQAQRSGSILSADMVAAGDRAGDAFGRLQLVGMALFAKVFLPLVPAIEAVANWLGTALPAALQFAQGAVDGLLRKGLELKAWLYDLAVSMSETIRDVPVLGRVFGSSAADIDQLRQSAQYARDQLNSFNAQGVKPVAEATRAATPLVTGFSEAMASAGRKARESGESVGIIWGEVSNIVRMQIAGVLNPSLTDFETHTNNVERAMQDLRDEMERVAGTAIRIGPVLSNTMKLAFDQGFKQPVQEVRPEVEGLFSKIFGDSQTLGGNISSIFQSAFTGGGGALGAVQSFATQTLSTLLGMVPGIGSWLSALAGPIVAKFSELWGWIGDGFRRLFGGPSGDELAGRELVEKFEDNIIAMLSETGKIQAGTDRWAQVVHGLTEQYVAMGLTEQQALEDARRLFESSRQGAEASKRVIEEINARLQAQGMAAEGAVDRIADALNDLPDVIDIEIRGHYRAPDIGDGYAGGTISKGSWFRDFGAATATVLHGKEAVVTPAQAPAFAQAVLGGGGDPELRRMVRELPRTMKLALREAMAMA